MAPLLEIRNLRMKIGGLRVINGLDMDVHEGEILGLIGPNGAGKTTLFNIISGFLQPDQGAILLRGKSIIGLRPHAIAQLGIVRSFQHGHLWNQFTVMDSMRAALHLCWWVGFARTIIHTPSAKAREREIDDRALEILTYVGMKHLEDQVVETLSHGYRKTLSIAIAMACNPTLLLLDEPLAALNPERANYVLDLFERIRDGGSTIMIIEHNMKGIFKVCDRIVAIQSGNKIAEGTPSVIRDDPAVISAYLGARKDVN